MTLVDNLLNNNNKILVIGNNDESTNHEVSQIAQKTNSVNHGLIVNGDFEPQLVGYYHTTVVDIPWGNLINLVEKFDVVMLLDQPFDRWSHWKCLQASVKLMLKLEAENKRTVFRHNQNVQNLLYWQELLYKKNKSFCIYPWINFNNQGNKLTLCARDFTAVTDVNKLRDWKTDENFVKIRSQMQQGESLPDHCSVCYEYEKLGIESYRQFETMDWVSKLNLNSMEDLDRISNPLFYEIQNGNHCNIKCRGCSPDFSAAIGKEFKKFKIEPPSKMLGVTRTATIQYIDIDNLTRDSSVYFQGGEPTIMPEVLEFMRTCIRKNKTDFFLTMCTNGVKLSNEFLKTIENFPNCNFSFSLDGYGKINDYWRSGSDWNKVIKNAHLLKSQGHSISVNTVPGIYNVTNLHLLFEFLDTEFPFTAMYLQNNHNSWQSPFNHPNIELVLDSMAKCQKTSVYHSNGKSCKSTIDSIYNWYTQDPICDTKELKTFFDFNDQLDHVRGVKLANYIPELEAARAYIKL